MPPQPGRRFDRVDEPDAGEVDVLVLELLEDLWRMYRFRAEMRVRVQLRRPEQEREEVVIIEAPDAMRAGRFEVVCCLQRAHDVEVAVKQAEDERGVVGFCDYTISTALAKIMFASSGMMLASTALGRINQVMEAPTLEAPSHPQTPRSNKVEFKDVSFTYNGSESPALSHVSFTAEPGQTVALVGPSGGGKTTAASLIPRFWDATSGAVEVGGVNVAQIDPHVLMDQVAFVFQNNRLFKTSILENVRVSRPEATREQVMAALMAAQCKDILDKLPDGLDTQIGTEGTYLSGGEQQRIALARAILKDAPIVVLDEATAFADPENEVLIQKAFATLTKDRTVIMIAHRLSTVVGADKIIVLEEGHIVEQGTHAELTASGGLYARMWTDYNKAVQWKITSEKEAE